MTIFEVANNLLETVHKGEGEQENKTSHFKVEYCTNTFGESAMVRTDNMVYQTPLFQGDVRLICELVHTALSYHNPNTPVHKIGFV